MGDPVHSDPDTKAPSLHQLFVLYVPQSTIPFVQPFVLTHITLSGLVVAEVEVVVTMLLAVEEVTDVVVRMLLLVVEEDTGVVVRILLLVVETDLLVVEAWIEVFLTIGYWSDLLFST